MKEKFVYLLSRAKREAKKILVHICYPILNPPKLSSKILSIKKQCDIVVLMRKNSLTEQFSFWAKTILKISLLD